MSETERRIVASNVKIEAYGKDTHSITIPPGWIKSIHIAINTAITCSAGTANANCSLKSIKVWHNEDLLVHLDGQSEVDDLQSGGIQLLREITAQQASVAPTDDFWNIPFDPPIPPGNTLLQYVNQSAEQIGADSSGTITAGDHNVEIEYARGGRKGGSLPYWRTGIWSDVANLGTCYHTLPAFPKPIRLIAFLTHDEGTRSATTYETLQMEQNGKTLWDGKLTKLKEEMQQKSGLASTAGVFWKGFARGLRSNGNNINLNFIAVSTGTKKYIEWLVICK